MSERPDQAQPPPSGSTGPGERLQEFERARGIAPDPYAPPGKVPSECEATPQNQAAPDDDAEPDDESEPDDAEPDDTEPDVDEAVTPPDEEGIEDA